MASSRSLYHEGNNPHHIQGRAESLSSGGGLPLPKKCPALHRTHRSKAIPIQQRSSIPKSKEEDNNLVSDYDKATWRMYNRIVEYRQKHNITYKTEAEESQGDQEVEEDSSRNLHQVLSSPNTSHPTDSSDHDEIFQLDN